MSRLNRRQVIGAGASGGALVLAVSCAPAGSGTEPGARPGGSGKTVTLRLGSRGNGNQGDPGSEQVIEGLKLFQTKHPTVTVDIVWAMNSEKFLAAAAAGDGFDVQDLCCAELPIEARAGALTKLDPLIKRTMKDSDIKDWIDWQYKYFNVDGAQYGIGKYMGTTALYYNKDWFQQKGVAFPDDTWDWNKYRDAMIKLTDIPNKKWGINLLGHLGTAGQSMSPDRRQAKVHQNGGNMVDPKNDLKSALDTPKTIEAFEWIHTRIWKDNASIQPQQLPGYPDSLLIPRLQFAQGYIAMWEEGSWGLLPLTLDKPNFQWDVVTLPKGPAQRDVLATTDGWAMWGGTKSLDDAWLLFSWFNSDDWYAIQSTRLQPARLSWLPKWQTLLTQTYPELQGKSLKAFTVGAEQGFAKPWELHRYHAETHTLIQTAFEESVTRNQKPVKDTHIEVARQVNEIQAKEHAARGGR